MLLVPCSLSVNAVKARQRNLKVIVLQLLWFLCSSKVADGSKCLYIWFSVAGPRSDSTSDFILPHNPKKNVFLFSIQLCMETVEQIQKQYLWSTLTHSWYWCCFDNNSIPSIPAWFSSHYGGKSRTALSSSSIHTGEHTCMSSHQNMTLDTWCTLFYISLLSTKLMQRP